MAFKPCKPCGCSPDHGSIVDPDCCVRAGSAGACSCPCHLGPSAAVISLDLHRRQKAPTPTAALPIGAAAGEVPVADLAAYRASRAGEPDVDLSSVTWMDDLLRDFPLVLTERTTKEGAVLLGPHHAVRAPAVRPYLRLVLKAALRALCPACNEGPLQNPEVGWCPAHAQTEELDRRVAVAVDGALGQRNDDPRPEEGESR